MNNNSTSLSGQWLGTFDGTSPGFAFLSIEPDRPTTGIATIVQDAPIPPSRLEFQVNLNGKNVSADLIQTLAFNIEDGDLVPAETYHEQNEDVVFDPSISIVGSLSENTLSGTWSGHNATSPFSLELIEPNKATNADYTLTWLDYKKYIQENTAELSGILYRGQTNSTWNLSTSLHRSCRFNHLRYVREDLPRLEHQINAVSDRTFNLSNIDDFGTFLSLAQHHGYPTPLLDWTKSPYIAAFFAFDTPSPESDFSRIYIFDSDSWTADTTQSNRILDPTPNLSIKELPARNNPRHVPQQSVHSYTNIHNIEWFIRYFEKRKQRKYLTTVDIPQQERLTINRDLELMGITNASLFPGIDGICKSLRKSHFPFSQ
ncbi:FRG domain-containing protein [Pelagicoccus mobilis]|uniref:FRG domain-containing protein n=1 Tax=Pelagicoccus mobilis TaxID=415221 RepID=A0A934RW23_9BACT|nr:FRG domain-containing protein [Pelagicoccus mobilis]MBK1878785.1 FRG domain-containing protein [Pelagicoccus mobilis]